VADPSPSTAPLDVEEQTLLAVAGGHHAKLLVGVLFNVPLVAAVAWALRRPGLDGPLAAWAGAVTASVLVRLAAWAHLRRVPATSGASAVARLRLSTGGTLLAGLIWGGGLLAFLPGAGTAERLLVTVVMAGMVAGSAGTLGDHLPAFLAFVLPALGPVVVLLGQSDDRLERLIGPLGALYLAAIALVAWMSGRRLRQALRLRFRGERLVAELTASQARLSALNADLEERVRERSERLAGVERDLSQAALLASVGGLAAGVAHEINNPLASVLTNVRFAEAALANGAPEEAEACREALADARTAAARVRDIVRSLSAVANADASSQPLDLVDLLEACAAVAASELRRRGVLVRELDRVPPVRASTPGLAQVFVQLLLRAARSLPEGDPTRCAVLLRTRHDELQAAVVVEIEARGPAVPGAGAADGAGDFGLRLARDVVGRLGGVLADRSGPGGAGYHVRLPVPRTPA